MEAKNTCDNVQKELLELQNSMLMLQNTLLKMEQNHLNIQQEWKNLSERNKQFIDNLEIDYKNKLKEMNELKFNLMNFKQEISKLLKIYHVVTRPRQFFKDLSKPRLGLLNQYSARPLLLPKHYNHHKISLAKYPQISIVTPSFNQGNFLEKTIISVVEQNYPALEYIIQDAGSNDESFNIIKRYEFRLKHWESKADKGQANAVNLGFQHASGEIMAYLNSDDILLPGALHFVAQFFNNHPEVDVVYGHRIIIDEHSHEIGRWILPPDDNNTILWADYIPQETLFWRRKIWEKIGGSLDESFKFALDWDLLLRFHQAGAKFVRLPRFLAAFRVHSLQKTSTEISSLGKNEMDRLRMRIHGKDLDAVEIYKNLRRYTKKHVIYHLLHRAGILQY